MGTIFFYQNLYWTRARTIIIEPPPILNLETQGDGDGARGRRMGIAAAGPPLEHLPSPGNRSRHHLSRHLQAMAVRHHQQCLMPPSSPRQLCFEPTPRLLLWLHHRLWLCGTVLYAGAIPARVPGAECPWLLHLRAAPYKWHHGRQSVVVTRRVPRRQAKKRVGSDQPLEPYRRNVHVPPHAVLHVRDLHLAH